MRGMTVTLYEEQVIGSDMIGSPIYEEVPVEVNNVLIGEPSSEDIVGSQDLYGKTISYMLGIPKGDTHVWHDRDLYIFGERFRTIGYPMTGIQDNIPLRWGQNVKVERYG